MKFWHPLLFLPVVSFLFGLCFSEMIWELAFVFFCMLLVPLTSSASYYVQQRKNQTKPVNYLKLIVSNLAMILLPVLIYGISFICYQNSYVRNVIDFKTYFRPCFAVCVYIILVQSGMSFYYFYLYKKDRKADEE